MAWTLPQAQIHHPLHPSVSSLVPALSLSLCYNAVCLGGARTHPLGLHHGSPLCLSVCLSVRLSLFPGVLCHRSPPRLICPCSNWPPTVLVAPNCVFFPPSRVTNHCPGAPALPPRTPARLPARPPTLRPFEPNAGPQGPEDSSGPNPPACPPAHRELTLSGSYVTAQPPALPVRRASGACLGKRSKTWSHVVSQSC